MKKALFFMISFVLMLVTGWAAYAATLNPQEQAGHVIKRSAVVLVAAQQISLKNGQYMGLALAVAHQRYARDLYIKGQYSDAIFHSLRARGVAIFNIKRNNGELLKEAAIDEVEEAYIQKMPSDSVLDQKVKAEGSDEAAAKVAIELTI
jgi:hypothetical protein